MIDVVPNDVLGEIINKLDDHSKFMISLVNKEMQGQVNQRELGKILKGKEDIRKETQRKINKLITRNIVIEGYVLYGECERCKRMGFLQEKEREHYNIELEQPMETICMERKCHRV